MGLEIELNLTEETGDPAMNNAHVLEMIADPAWQTELAQFNIEINIPPRTLEGGVLAELEAEVRASLNHAEDGRQEGATPRLLMVGILPTLRRGHARRARCSAPTRATSCSTSRSSPPAGRTCTSRSTASSGCRCTRTRSPPRRRARASSCTSTSTRSAFAGTGTRRKCIAGVQLAVGANSPFFFGTRAVARDAHRAVRAGDRHPLGGAQGAGRAPAGVVRRALDHLDLRPVRGERPLLPVAAADRRRRGPGRGAASAATRRSWQELRLHNGTIYRWNRPIYDVVRGRPHLRVENRVPAGRPDGGRHARQRRLLLRAGHGARRRGPAAVVADVVLGRGGELPQRRHATASTRASTGPESARCRPTELVLRRLLPDGPRRARTAGASTPPTAIGCSASSSAAASSGRNGASWQADDVPPLLREPRSPRRAARDDVRVSRAHALQRAGAHLADRLTSSSRSLCCCSSPPRPSASKRFTACVAESSGCHHHFVSGDLPVLQIKDRKHSYTHYKVCVRDRVHRAVREPDDRQEAALAPRRDVEHRRRSASMSRGGTSTASRSRAGSSTSRSSRSSRTARRAGGLWRR